MLQLLTLMKLLEMYAEIVTILGIKEKIKNSPDTSWKTETASVKSEHNGCFFANVWQLE